MRFCVPLPAESGSDAIFCQAHSLDGLATLHFLILLLYQLTTEVIPKFVAQNRGKTQQNSDTKYFWRPFNPI